MALEFEKPILELEQKIDEMRKMSDSLDISDEINRLEQKVNELRKNVFDNLTPWQIVQLARHPNRPYTLDYIYLMTENFVELHGDRGYKDDKAVVGGLANIGEHSVMIIGQQKGR
ncbi:MAG: acetyl-CoA carboxylase carboxyl transferase subunit alpha, partial [Ignavibacteria bacterium]|nr:acetyl-CoA carboxylase carboxyl transferase subunit alpha [Ignavibacteria bacterium]